MERIVVGFDGTPSSTAAVEWVARRAASRSCHVALVVIDAAEPFEPVALDGARDDALRRLRAAAPQIEVSIRTAPGSTADDALIDAAEVADLLVIGAHGSRAARSATADWPPLRTVARSVIPVVVVPETWTVAAGPVLVGVDGDTSRAAVDFAAEEAARGGVALTLLHAWQTPAPTVHGTMTMIASPNDERRRSSAILDGVGERVLDAHPDLPIDRILTRGAASQGLLMESRRSSLLVLGTGDGAADVTDIVGTVGRDVLVEARIPVCVTPSSPR